MIARKLILAAASCALATAASAAVFVADFSQLAYEDVLNGYPDAPPSGAPWGQSEANPDSSVYGNVNVAPLAWGQEATVGSQVVSGAAVGTYYDVPTNDIFYADHAVGENMSASWFVVSFLVQDSTAEYPGRNDFFFALADPDGNELMHFQLTGDDSGATDKWNMTWTDMPGGGTGIGGAPAAVLAGGIYKLTVKFVPDGQGGMTYQLSVEPDCVECTDSYYGGWESLTDVGSDAVIDSFRMGADLGIDTVNNTPEDVWGDNYLLVLGVSIPEPASVALVGLGVLGLVVRRRR